ncbi:cytochrome P450 [Suillus subaureus]|uniref:Cytochrome P450 n=1 Tax=Suillus subaureus TaxID=48587 RepID=A0A9P7DJY5_9AGAM|nr:cytochrome P450 [Suillus subaureus]KAG1796592.1 cytochrome P450 [Suillus subaureus]
MRLSVGADRAIATTRCPNQPQRELLAFNADPTYDQLKADLPYLDVVVHETLRLHTPSGRAHSSWKGTLITIPVAAINRSSAIWGPDAKEFKPARWLAEDGISGKANEVQAVLSVLVKNFVFEMRDGPDTPIEVANGLLPRPRVVGEDGIGVPLRVRRSEEDTRLALRACSFSEKTTTITGSHGSTAARVLKFLPNYDVSNFAGIKTPVLSSPTTIVPTMISTPLERK